MISGLTYSNRDGFTRWYEVVKHLSEGCGCAKGGRNERPMEMNASRARKSGGSGIVRIASGAFGRHKDGSGDTAGGSISRMLRRRITVRPCARLYGHLMIGTYLLCII